MIHHPLKYIWIILLLSLSFTQLSAQVYHYQKFGAESGLGNSFIVSIDQDDRGFIVVGTGEGIFNYNGKEFKPISNTVFARESVVTTSFKDKDERLWFGTSDGAIAYYGKGALKILDTKDIISSKVSSFAQDRDENIWVATQSEGILKIAADGKISKYQGELTDYVLEGIVCDDFGRLIIGSDLGLIVLNEMPTANTFPELDFKENLGMSRVSTISPLKIKNQFLVSLEDEGIFWLKSTKDKVEFRGSADNDSFAMNQINDLDMDDEDNIWVSTNRNSLLRYQMLPDGINYRIIDYNHDNSLGCSSIKTSYLDPEKNLWIGTYGQGLFKLDDRYFNVFTYPEFGTGDQNVGAVFPSDGRLWVGSFGHIVRTGANQAKSESLFDERHGLPKSQISGIAEADDGDLWVSTLGAGLFKKSAGDTTFQSISISVDELSKTIHAIGMTKDFLYCGTIGGIYRRDLKSKQWKRYSTTEGLPHNYVTAVHVQDEDVYIALKGTQLVRINGDEMELIDIATSNRLADINGITLSKDGSLWLATSGNGVLEVKNEETKEWKKESGLMSNFCYSIGVDIKGKVWATHRGGLSRLHPKEETVEFFDSDDGVDMAFNSQSIATDIEGNLWWGADKGLLCYNPERDVQNRIEPTVNILNVALNDSAHAYNQIIDLQYGIYKLKIDFIGLSYRNASGVSYKYFLEGFDADWSDRTFVDHAIYNRLSAGDYRFYVKSYNADGIGGETMQSVEISIGRPYWQKWWFFLLLTATVFTVVRYFIIRRERFLKRNQEYLQRELDERTNEVVSQKEMLEEKNKDITDSIIYAKNIQGAMLPSKDAMQKAFGDSFVYFNPRDIVSGDFYWVKRYENRVVLAIADCTGHGVPGAFMSLISISILKEVANDPSIKSPSEALDMVQETMRTTLRADNDDSINDGMDIAIIEYDLETRIVRFASARRPVVMYLNGERMTVPGDRVSIGDVTDGYKFTLHTQQLSVGDSFYAFSDGYADQFGGIKGKKMKSKSLYTLLDQVQSDDMQTQSEMVKVHFDNWRGEHRQVDDVIFIGVRVT